MAKLFGKNGSISKSFSKASGSVKKFFNKDVKHAVNETASGLGSVGHALHQATSIGGKIVGAVENSPYGQQLGPLTGMARQALNATNLLGNIANTSKHVLKDTTSGKSADKIVGSVLEKAKRIENDSKGIQFH